MNCAADGHQRKARLAGDVLVLAATFALGRHRFIVFIVVGISFGLRRADCGGERQNGQSREDYGEDQRRHPMRTKNVLGDEEKGIAEDAAEAGRQRPTARHRQNRSKTGRRDAADQPEEYAPADPVEPPGS